MRPGDTVRFLHEGAWKTGIVNGINRRATVLVPVRSGILFDDDRRYRRYYVPLELLDTANIKTVISDSSDTDKGKAKGKAKGKTKAVKK